MWGKCNTFSIKTGKKGCEILWFRTKWCAVLTWLVLLLIVVPACRPLCSAFHHKLCNDKYNSVVSSVLLLIVYSKQRSKLFKDEEMNVD